MKFNNSTLSNTTKAVLLLSGIVMSSTSTIEDQFVTIVNETTVATEPKPVLNSELINKKKLENNTILESNTEELLESLAEYDNISDDAEELEDISTENQNSSSYIIQDDDSNLVEIDLSGSTQEQSDYSSSELSTSEISSFQQNNIKLIGSQQDDENSDVQESKTTSVKDEQGQSLKNPVYNEENNE